MIGLEVVEKLFWTNYDFIVLRPKEFCRIRSENPSRYMDPIPFAVSMVVLYHLALISCIRFVSPFVDWNSIIGVRVNMINVTDTPSLIPITSAFVLFSLLFALVLTMAGAKIMRQKLKARDALIGLCFGCATSSVMIAYIGMASFAIFLRGSMVGEATGIARQLYVGIQFLNVPLFVYYCGSVAAFGEISFWRLLVGTIFAYVGFFALLIVVLLIVSY
jgi:hypothetical protein